jgi:hypothetical protein
MNYIISNHVWGVYCRRRHAVSSHSWHTYWRTQQISTLLLHFKIIITEWYLLLHCRLLAMCRTVQKISRGMVWNGIPGTKHQYITWCFRQITVQLKMVCCVAVIVEPTRPQKWVSPMHIFFNTSDNRKWHRYKLALATKWWQLYQYC